MPYCPECGGEIKANEKFCFSCGSKLPEITRSPSNKSVSEDRHMKLKIGGVGVGTISSEQEPEPESIEVSDNDIVAIRDLKIFALLELFGLAFVSVLPFVAGFGGIISIIGNPLNSSNMISSLGHFVGELVILLLFGSILGVGASLFVRQSFNILSDVDDEFNTPRTLSSVLIGGLFSFFLAGIFLSLAVFTSARASAVNATYPPAVAASIGLEFILTVVFFAIGVIPTIIGGLGAILGLWRAGHRYDQGVLKIAAILQAIPFMNLVSSILVFAGAQNTKIE